MQVSAQQKIFSVKDLLAVVQTHHPVARQAALQNDFTEAGVLAARGHFDPVAATDISSKKVGNQLYYRVAEHQLRIPTWYGVDLYAGAETVNGIRVDPSETKGAVSYVGVSVPLARNLLFDSRRASLRQAQLMEKMSRQEQREVLNDLSLAAMKAYWNWWAEYARWELYDLALKNAQVRFDLVKLAVNVGERPAIDTVEALTQLQEFLQSRVAAANALQNARVELSAFLWLDGGQHYELPADVIPDRETTLLPEQLQTIDALLQAAANHPELEQNRLKIQSFQIDERLKKQLLLPQVNVKYNQLTTSYQIGEALRGPWLQNDYRYGISISMPLRLSEGRGAYRQAQVKTEQARLEQKQKQVLIQNKIRQEYNDWLQLQQQVALQEQKLAMLRQLQRGEELRFRNGESSLFLINSREAKALEAGEKLIELRSKLQQAANEVLWASGTLGSL